MTIPLILAGNSFLWVKVLFPSTVNLKTVVLPFFLKYFDVSTVGSLKMDDTFKPTSSLDGGVSVGLMAGCSVGRSVGRSEGRSVGRLVEGWVEVWIDVFFVVSLIAGFVVVYQNLVVVLNLWIKGIIDKIIDNYLAHQIQQPILKLRIRNFHEFFQPIFDKKKTEHTILGQKTHRNSNSCFRNWLLDPVSKI